MMSHYRDYKDSESRYRYIDDYRHRHRHKRDPYAKEDYKYRRRSSSSHRSRYRSRSRSRSRDRYYYSDRSSYSKEKNRHSESKESENKTTTSDKKYELFKKKKSSWDSKTPVSNLDPELCDTRLIYKDKKSSQQNTQDDHQNTKIYVGSLDPGCTDSDLRTVFSSFGEILNIEIPLDPQTNKSKGYCFIEYRNKQSADLAMSSMQGFNIKGKPIKIGRPNISSSGLSVSGIGAIGYNNPLSNPLAAGAVAAATLLQNRSGIRVDTSNVLSKLSASTTSITVAPTPPELNGKRVVLENIPFELSANDVRRIFEPFGTILDCVLYSRDMLPGAFFACGYIDFQNPNVAQTVCSTMNGFEIAGSKVQVTMAPESSVTGSSNVIVLYNMVEPSLADENLSNEVREECNKYGLVTSVYLHFSPTNDSLSVFVVFNTTEDAENAVRSLNTRWFNGRQIMCKTYDAAAYFSGNYEL